jgi:phage tail protein X
MQTYKTRAGDVVDEIAWRHYGSVDAAILREVFAANPGLADAGALLPANVTVILPDIQAPTATAQGVALWD